MEDNNMKNILIAIFIAVFLCSSPLMAKGQQEYKHGGGHGGEQQHQSYSHQGNKHQGGHQQNYNHYRHDKEYHDNGYHRGYDSHHHSYYYYNPHHPDVHYYPAYVYGYPRCDDCYYDEHGNFLDLYWDGHGNPQIQLRLNLH
jgi:hypothetical protein